MNRRTSRTLLMLVIAGVLSAFAALMAIYPSAALSSAVRGLSIWWDVLFPSLLPFFIISEALLGFGIVHFIGALLDPVMRPLFRVPGIGGFVVAMGYASGYPVGAKLTTRLRADRLVTREEGERLIAFTSTSDPIFLIGAVAVGFFGNAGLALILAAAHYGAGLIIGIMMRFHASASPMTPSSSAIRDFEGFLFRRAFQAMHQARRQDGRSLGTLLRDAIGSSLRLMTVVGGLVVFFSVLMEMLACIGVMHIIDSLLQSALALFHLSPSLAPAFSGGLFEVTLGAKGAGAADAAGLRSQVVAAAWILSWAGLSVHAQIASIMNECDMRYLPFLAARVLHSLLAAGAAYFLFPLLAPYTAEAAIWFPSQMWTEAYAPWETAWHSLRGGLWTLLAVCGLLFAASLLCVAWQRMRNSR
ncbi:sporulation integral membrane protein YlbJ [Paenibacillus melissococcoides]|uniref:Sporulation integral membrane protein YlbJ n=1 Tax=Paenibacillus melissococcoides TaxID=2912268 RepID=A0ABN8TWN6_9BACL|nr:sporulation integral membrane protein YlbJ [Paenibacillus melissococcoides]MEB9894741.1 sporulation integral membrane protein YlbJ [Bacillus cereus]CAH8243120.1 sporulation integral membrane protein YlbJ [Paenibacillus melissococcoides]CAH8703789.1 sporulation integral membrane protein YlbJ [Paenibacillus melissococcoides]CAH8706842.1 sporulation integral membrane protein YlbJ [Paenibacillus melissococcoides]